MLAPRIGTAAAEMGWAAGAPAHAVHMFGVVSDQAQGWIMAL